jgi:hypothetical protein
MSMNNSQFERVDTFVTSIDDDDDDRNARAIVIELIDLLDENRSNHETVIVTEIIQTVHLLVKQGGKRRDEIIAHPQVRRRFFESFSLSLSCDHVCKQDVPV